MPVTKVALQRAIARQQQWLKVLEGVDASAAADIQVILDEYTRAILRSVGVSSSTRGEAFKTAKEVNVAIKELDAELRVLLRKAGVKHRKAFATLKSGQGQATLEAYSFFGKTTAGRVKAAVRAFDKQKLPGSFLQGRDRWLDEVNRVGTQLRDSMREKMVQAQLEGMGQHQLAQRIAADPLFRFENLPKPDNARAIYNAKGLGENVALRRRAEVIARDANSIAANRMHEEWTQAAGFKYYINYNVMDSRTTPGCREASKQPAKTLQEWDGWVAKSDSQAGRPPRWFQCRSQLMAVPPKLRQETGA